MNKAKLFGMAFATLFNVSLYSEGTVYYHDLKRAIVYDNNSNGIFDSGSKGFSSANLLSQSQEDILSRYFKNELEDSIENIAKNYDLQGIYFINDNNRILSRFLLPEMPVTVSRMEAQNLLDYLVNTE